MLPHGRYSKVDPKSPIALARCDITGLLCSHKDLVKQMRYTGRGTAWTGLYVHKKFADKLNPQELTPLIQPDPLPVRNPRPDPLSDYEYEG